MANQTQRIRSNFQTGLLAATVTNVGTTISLGTVLSGVATISTSAGAVSGTFPNQALLSGQYLPIVINPAPFASTSSTAAEIVWVYAYTAGSTTATILRQQEGTTIPAGSWGTGVPWTHGPTSQDFNFTNQLLNSDFPAATASGQVFTSVSGGQAGSYTWTTPTVPTNTTLTSPVETSTIINTGASGILNYDTITSSIRYHTVAASGNVTLNVRGSSTVPFSSVVGSGQTMTVVQLITNGATPYYISTFQIDSVTVPSGNLKWQGGATPVAGNPSATDVYSYTIICTAPSTYTVLGSVNRFV